MNKSLALLLIALLGAAHLAAARHLTVTVGQEVTECLKLLKCKDKKAAGICGVYKVDEPHDKRTEHKAFHNRCEFACYNYEISNWHMAYRFDLSEACKKEWEKDGSFGAECEKQCHSG